MTESEGKIQAERSHKMLQSAFYSAQLHHWPDENVAVVRKKQKAKRKKMDTEN
jgi:hypothetical protein